MWNRTVVRCLSGFLLVGCLSAMAQSATPAPMGTMVDLGGHRLHVNCSGAGSPTVVVENGLGDFSFDWVLVDAAFEGMRVGIGGGKTLRLGEDAKGKSIPEPRETMLASDKPAIPADA